MKEESRSPSQELQAPAAAKPSHVYDEEFVLTDEYRASLPDMQNADSQQIYGANVPILKVGISNFRMPLRYITPISDTHTLETSVTGTVSLEANQKGINMSRSCGLYDFHSVFSPRFVAGNSAGLRNHSRTSRDKAGVRIPDPQEHRSGPEVAVPNVL